jgi:hypothetical protein
MQATCRGKSLNASLTSRTTITSPSSPALPHAKLNLRRSSTLYDTRGPRLRLGRGRLGKHSGRPRQTQTTREKVKRPGRNSPTRPRGGFPDKASQLSFNAPWRTAMCDGTYQLPSIVTHFYFPLCPSPCDYKRERRATITRVRLSYDQTLPPGTWERSPSPD